MKLPELTAIEARVIGCLIEKQITTPDQYPLSLNALVNACNQKSNRDPLMDVDEPTVQRTVDDLGKKHLIIERSGFGSRVPKYQHRFCNTEFGTLKLSPQEVAIVCELLLRGPQTPGELRPRAARMAPFASTEQVEAVLEGLRTREDGPFVVRLARQAGRRDSQWAHLFSGPVDAGVETELVVGRGGVVGVGGGGAVGGVGVGGDGGDGGGAVAGAVGGSGSGGGAISLAQGVAPPFGAGAAGAAGAGVARAAGGAGTTASGAAGTRANADAGASADAARIDRLEAEVRQLREELDSLKKQLGV